MPAGYTGAAPPYAPISQNAANIPGRKPKRKIQGVREDLKTARRQGRSAVTSKPTRQRDISAAYDPLGANAKQSKRGGALGNGMTVGLRF